MENNQVNQGTQGAQGAQGAQGTGKLDLSSVLANAAKENQQVQENSGGGMKLIYPQDGTLKVRLIFNQQSGVVMRKVDRHKVNNNQVACLQHYGQDCPVCKVVKEIETVTGNRIWQIARTTRGIAYAEYVGSDYNWSGTDSRYIPEPGEIVLLMFPQTIYNDINRIISTAGDNIASLIASNVGGVFNIIKYKEGSQVKYKAEIDAFNMNHQTRPSDEEYNKLILELPTLNEKVLPPTLTNELVLANRAAAEDLSAQYLQPHVLQQNLGSTGQPINQFNQLGQQPPVPNQMDPFAASYGQPPMQQQTQQNQWQQPTVQQTPPNQNPNYQNYQEGNLGGQPVQQPNQTMSGVDNQMTPPQQAIPDQSIAGIPEPPVMSSGIYSPAGEAEALANNQPTPKQPPAQSAGNIEGAEALLDGVLPGQPNADLAAPPEINL